MGAPMVFHTAPPQPLSNARMICSPQFVGGPEASQKGLGLRMPAKLVVRSGMLDAQRLFTTEAQRHRGKPKKIGRRGLRSGAFTRRVARGGGRGDREHGDIVEVVFGPSLFVPRLKKDGVTTEATFACPSLGFPLCLCASVVKTLALVFGLSLCAALEEFVLGGRTRGSPRHRGTEENEGTQT